MGRKEQRLFNIRDESLIIRAELFRDYYYTYREHFTAFNEVLFHENYTEEFRKAIDKASFLLSDRFILGNQIGDTQRVKNAAKELLSRLECIAFMVKSTYFDQPEILDEWRIKEMKSISKNADNFIIYASDLLVNVDKCKAELQMYGLQEAHISVARDALANLNAKRRLQVSVMQERPVQTRKRVAEMNNIWKRMVSIRNAAELIFRDQPTTKDLFKLPQKSKRTYGTKNMAG